MKLHSFKYQIFIFSIILIFFILPPVISGFSNPAQNSFSSWNFPLTYSVLFICSCFIYFSNREKKFSDKTSIFYKFIFPATFIFCLLFFNSLIFKAISLFVSKTNFFSDTIVVKPKGIKEICYCLLNFLFSATYEEIIYRFYFPDALLLLFPKSKKILRIFFEFLAAFIFAISHLYLGILAVINAFTAHLILRIIYKKTDCIYSNIAAHFFYNIITLLVY